MRKTTINDVSLDLSNIISAALIHSLSQRKTTFRIMVIGKTGVGKSSTINSILKEKGASTVGALTSNATDVVTTFTRQVLGLELVLIDTPGLTEKDRISKISINKIKNYLSQIEGGVDVVMYCERTDLYRLEPMDKRVVYEITDNFGESIWQRAMVVFTRAGTTNIPAGKKFSDLIQERVEMISRTVAMSSCSIALPVVFVENLVTRNESTEWSGNMTENCSITSNVTTLLLLISSIKACCLFTKSEIPPFKFDPNKIKISGPNMWRKVVRYLFFDCTRYMAFCRIMSRFYTSQTTNRI
jgi:predicted GTPase